MDEAEKLDAFMSNLVDRVLGPCAKKIANRLMRRMGGSDARVSVRREAYADPETMEFITVDVIETRISGPK